MTLSRLPLFCGVDLAARIERVEAGLVARASAAAHLRESSGFTMPIAGGVACFAEADSPFNKIAGLGFAGVPSLDELAEVEHAFAECGSSVQVELAHLVDPAIGVLLTERGYRLEAFENVLGLAISGPPVRSSGVEVRRSGDDEFDAWLDIQADAVATPDTQGVPWHEEFPRDVYLRAERDMAAAGVLRYAALLDGVLVGGAAFRISDGIAQFAGAATSPAYRRRGVQTALLSARLADAAAAGCDVAVITAQPGSTSQQNAQRSGFDLLYTRAVLVKS
jgi:GNAT superfamily N-acetyltransferase